MSQLAFRVSVPTATPANNPLTLNLVSMSPAVRKITIWVEDQNAGGGVFTLQTGWRISNRNGVSLVPDMGSNDLFTAGNGETGWGPASTIPQCLDMDDRVIEGPPHILQLQFYNVHASILAYMGFIEVVDPFAMIARNAALYEFLTGDGAKNNDVSPETKTVLQSSIKDKDTLAEIRRNLEPIVKPGKRNESVEHIIQK